MHLQYFWQHAAMLYYCDFTEALGLNTQYMVLCYRKHTNTARKTSAWTGDE